MTTQTLSPATTLAASLNTPQSPIPPGVDWMAKIHELGPLFAARADEHDQTETFVAQNYSELKAAKIFAAGVPAALGGGDASYQETCEMVRTLAHYCGSTALTLSMHFHLIAAMVWKWRNLQAPVDAFLQRVAREGLVLVSSGGSDWLQSSGRAELSDGGYLINARKVFSSGCPAGDLLMTSAVYDDPELGPTVLHFPIALHSPQVKIIPTWHTLGMRGTGSHDILIEEAFVPASALNGRRPRGQWHASLHLVSKMALPLIYSTYVGLAETARDLALRENYSKRENPETQLLAGEMENELFGSRLSYERMVEIGAHWQPGPETTNAVLKARTLTAQFAIRTVDKALEIVGGRSFYRNVGLERLYRDVQGARFHPIAEKPQQKYAGRMAFGLNIDLA